MPQKFSFRYLKFFLETAITYCIMKIFYNNIWIVTLLKLWRNLWRLSSKMQYQKTQQAARTAQPLSPHYQHCSSQLFLLHKYLSHKSTWYVAFPLLAQLIIQHSLIKQK